MERSFADGKELHGQRYARMRGLDKVKEQCLLAAACQNMKKIAQIKARRALLSLFRRITGLSGRISRSLDYEGHGLGQYRFVASPA